MTAAAAHERTLSRRAAARPADPLASFVIPAYNEAESVGAMLDALRDLAARLALRHEIVVVDDGSDDGTAERVLESAAGRPVTLVRLSRNFGKEIALTAGLDHAAGDIAILLDCDFQHCPDEIPAFLARWREGYDMVYGLHADRGREGWLKRLLIRGFYLLLNAGSGRPIPEGSQDFRLLDRSVVDALRRLPERNRFMKGLCNWVGFTTLALPTRAGVRQAGATRFGLAGLFRLALTGLTAFSVMPLRLWLVAGALVSLASIAYAAVILVDTLIHGNAVSGWPTLAVSIFFLGGVQLLSIGILGEYIGRVFDEVKMRPVYLTSEVVRLDAPAVAPPPAAPPPR